MFSENNNKVIINKHFIEKVKKYHLYGEYENIYNQFKTIFLNVYGQTELYKEDLETYFYFIYQYSTNILHLWKVFNIHSFLETVAKNIHLNEIDMYETELEQVNIEVMENVEQIYLDIKNKNDIFDEKLYDVKVKFSEFLNDIVVNDLGLETPEDLIILIKYNKFTMIDNSMKLINIDNEVDYVLIHFFNDLDIKKIKDILQVLNNNYLRIITKINNSGNGFFLNIKNKKFEIYNNIFSQQEE